jgi:hypothetical protein
MRLAKYAKFLLPLSQPTSYYSNTRTALTHNDFGLQANNKCRTSGFWMKSEKCASLSAPAQSTHFIFVITYNQAHMFRHLLEGEARADMAQTARSA